MSYSVVWFKRDLRAHDHAALAAAAAQGPLLCLYIVEPRYWREPDTSSQHYLFLQECLIDLEASLTRRGISLLLRVGEVVDVLQSLYQVAPFSALFSHEETGNAFTFERDKAVARWCRGQNVPWSEFAQTGVVRRLASRQGWAQGWEERVAQPCIPVPDMRAVKLPLARQRLPEATELCVHLFDPPQRQVGGRRQGIRVLHEFLTERSAQYSGGISSPLSAPTACSRLSPYLAYGCLSLREVVQATRRQLAMLPTDSGRQRKGLQGFMKRLHWHCHFMQKLESEPEIEWRNMHQGYDGLRESEFNHAYLDTLMHGRTGWPLVDACVAMLNATGWLNFRMRAMLVSVAAYPLWLHWRPVGLWLARAFLDYEPGIHWSQLQMQSGTTGINATRVYNPIKQALDHDPKGVFVRHWLPCMRRVPDAWLFEPWRMPPSVREQYRLSGTCISAPVVDLESATRQAKQRLHDRRAQQHVRAAKQGVLERHGSRLLKPRQQSGKTKPSAQKEQLGLPFAADWLTQS